MPLNVGPLNYERVPPCLWSILPVVIASGLYGVFITSLAFVLDTKFRQIFTDFQIAIPTWARLVFFISRIIWSDFGWVILLPLLIGWPLLILPRVPVPERPQARSRAARTAEILFFLIFAFTLAGFLATGCLPML